MKINRRSFLKKTAAATGALSIPTIVPSSVFGKNAPSNRVNIGCIGVGNQGSGLMKNVLYNDQAQVVAVCDCFASRRQAALDTIKDIYTQTGKESRINAKAYADFRELLAREDIDGITVATPDHWHVPIACHAVRAGKDMYVEKPLGVSMKDGFKLRNLVRDKKAIFQYGTMQRSDHYFRFACELVRNGYIGQLQKMDVWCENIGDHQYTKTMPKTQPVPEDLDYDQWIGPAPMKPYCDVRVSNLGAWHIYDYALGFIAGWGAHPLDIAQWGNNSDDTAPIHYEGTGTVPSGGLFDTVSFWDLHCTYANGVKMHFMDHATAIPVVSKYHPELRRHGTTFHGTDGWISVRRGAIDFSDETLRRVKLKEDETHLYNSKTHMGNFIECIKTRKKPISTIEAAVQSDLISHLSNAVVRLKRPIKWDPKNERIINDQEATKMLDRPKRSPGRYK
ncbi:Inositol 2-dehydrogenase [Anaerohalosphaera lusitana]|uniref:Inositol 2-dehydrogenase n=1 Tax=Anaerohalosphaera lusitana TaxID=1936003 RepID=A0A1U9NJN3_9BACT|nr:Gfo/Idh/MocA family oxidoreductase [Anaerohalosphaera lusitana]AQT68143.1 Inositol 2-dehydrogenase [Anaerohalosphaera lusitana]